MGKRNRTLEDREVRQLRWFQWECLRRNSEYRSDYNNLIERFGDWLRRKRFWYERHSWSDRDSYFFYSKVCPVLRAICIKWQIKEPFPPDWIFDSHGEYESGPGNRVYLPTGCSADSAGSLFPQGPVERVRNRKGFHGRASEPVRNPFRWPLQEARRKTESQWEDDPRYLQLKLDVTRPQEALLEQTLTEIRFHRRKHSKFLAKFLSKAKFKSRRRLDQYDIYLKVWDLRQKGLSFPEIAKQLYPREYGPSPDPRNPIIQRVRDHYSRADELIQGGYKELT